MKKNKIIENAQADFNQAKDYFEQDYARGKEDVAFALGHQWDDSVRQVRGNRPEITENRLLPFVQQVVNSIRQQRLSIRPRPVDSDGDLEVADILKGIIRNIEAQSDAETIYDTAAQNAIMSGFGWVRINTKYCDDDSFDQDIILEGIYNPFSVYLDPESQRMDGADARFCVVIDYVPKDKFKELYPKAQTKGFTEADQKHGWGNNEDRGTIAVADYYYKEFKQVTIVKTYQGVFDKGDQPEDAVIVSERKVERCTVKFAKVTALDVLQETELLTKYIPVVPVYGFRAWNEERFKSYSLIHQAKDPQRMYNYWITASTETFALQPKAPWLVAEGTIRGYEESWKKANTSNPAFLPYKIVPIGDGSSYAPAPKREAPPALSPSLMNQAMVAAEGIKASLGMYAAQAGEQTSDVSGKAIIARQAAGENATFHFVDNLKISMRHIGRILVEMIPQIYNAPQIVRVLGEDDTERLIPINQPVVQRGNNYEAMPFGAESLFPNVSQVDLSNGKYDVVVEVGNSYATKRQEAANALLESVRIKPELFDVVGDYIFKNMDIPHAEDIAKRIRSTMNPELLGDDLEAQRLQMLQGQLTQVMQRLEETEAALLAKRENEQFKNNLELQKVELDKQKIQINAMETMAKIRKLDAETQQEIPAQAMADVALANERMAAQVDDLQAALSVILDALEDAKDATGAQSPE